MFIKRPQCALCMGRIKTRLIKRVTRELVQTSRDELTTTFNENKRVVDTYVDTQSKKLRNMIAGYATRLKRKQAAE